MHSAGRKTEQLQPLHTHAQPAIEHLSRAWLGLLLPRCRVRFHINKRGAGSVCCRTNHGTVCTLAENAECGAVGRKNKDKGGNSSIQDVEYAFSHMMVSFKQALRSTTCNEVVQHPWRTANVVRSRVDQFSVG